MPVDNAELLRRRMQQAQPFAGLTPIPPAQPAWRRDVDWSNMGAPAVAPPVVEPVAAVAPQQEIPVAPTPNWMIPQIHPIAPTPAEQRLAELVGRPPSLEEGAPGYRREYAHPGKLNRLAAILSGIGAGIQQGGAAGFQTAQAIRLAPYQRAVGDWQRQVEALDPLIQAQLRREQLGETAYGHDITRFNAMLDRMSAQDLNEVRQRTLAETQRYHTLSLQEQEADRRQQFQTAAQQSSDRLAAIDARLRTTEITQRGAAERQTQDIESAAGRQAKSIKSAESIAAAGRAAAAARTRAQIESREKVAKTGARESEKMLQEYNAAQRLLRAHPEYTEFLKMEEGQTPRIVFAGEVKPQQRDLYKQFLNDLARETESSASITIEREEP